MNMATLETRSKQAIFSKWLPRTIHYAHKICIEILNRTRSPFPSISHLDPKSIWKSPNIVPWAECRPVFPDDAAADDDGDDNAPTTVPSGQTPIP